MNEHDMISNISYIMRLYPETTEKILIKHGADPSKEYWTDGCDVAGAYEELLQWLNSRYDRNDQETELDHHIQEILGWHDVNESVESELEIPAPYNQYYEFSPNEVNFDELPDAFDHYKELKVVAELYAKEQYEDALADNCLDFCWLVSDNGRLMLVTTAGLRVYPITLEEIQDCVGDGYDDYEDLEEAVEMSDAQRLALQELDAALDCGELDSDKHALAYQIQWDINFEDVVLFINGVGIDLRDIKHVAYGDCDGTEFDGCYSVTLNNGEVKRYGWHDFDMTGSLTCIDCNEEVELNSLTESISNWKDLYNYKYQFKLYSRSEPNSTFADDALRHAEECGCVKIYYPLALPTRQLRFLFICKNKSDYDRFREQLSTNKVLRNLYSVSNLTEFDVTEVEDNLKKILKQEQDRIALNAPVKRRGRPSNRTPKEPSVAIYVDDYSKGPIRVPMELTNDLHEGTGSDTAHVIRDVLTTASKEDKDGWAKTIADIIDVVPDQYIDDLYDIAAEKLKDVKVTDSERKKIVDASGSSIDLNNDIDTIGKILALFDVQSWDAATLKNFVLVVLGIVAVIEPTPVLEIVTAIVSLLPADIVKTILSITNMIGNPVGAIGTIANRAYQKSKNEDYARVDAKDFIKHPMNYDVTSMLEFEVQDDVKVYIHRGPGRQREFYIIIGDTYVEHSFNKLETVEKYLRRNNLVKEVISESFKPGDVVYVTVCNRQGRVRKMISPDVVEVELHDNGVYPERIDRYYVDEVELQYSDDLDDEF